ncbi:ammonium transporter [Streptococcus pseudoporcinus]|uniref:Ammonium transporter n=1 Tax=Streptococcus pseudoporcinus TaxID=361101 RepID=A0A4U9YCK3_9STRE|nr:ammonium transporter [Streptococcus pseudoporcinus]
MDTGSISFILICTALVCLMTPALAFFYGGLGRRKNVINTMMMSIIPLSISSLMWVIVGYSLSFGGDDTILGNFSHLFLNDVSFSETTRNLDIPDLLFAAFHWLLLVYYPFAHMVWDEGLLAQWGTIDFAGGDVIHITSGVSGLVLAIVVGNRKDYDHIEYRPHNVPVVLLGAGLLWFGWFEFNAGSALSANPLAIHALMTTHISAASAMASWLLIEKIIASKFSLVGGATGLIAGLVAITPGAGFVSIWSSLLIGLLVSPICYFSIHTIKTRFKIDDSLDAFGCHGIGGIFGGLITAVFTKPDLALNKEYIGLIYGDFSLLLVTIIAIIFTILWSAIVSYVLIKIIATFTELRVTEREDGLMSNKPSVISLILICFLNNSTSVKSVSPGRNAVDELAATA